MQTHHGLYKRRSLSSSELGEIAQLADLCNQFESLHLKLNWNTLRSRHTDKFNDFLYYEAGQLVGFLPIFNFNSGEAEVSGMVHPDYRRRGIFTALLQAARTEMKKRHISALLFIVERASQSGKLFAASLGARYSFSEYKMTFYEPPASILEGRLHFRKAGREDIHALAHITAVSFGLSEHSQENWYISVGMNNENRRIYIAFLDEQPVGKLDVAFLPEEISIAGFGVLPAYRGHGYGREILTRTIQDVRAGFEQHLPGDQHDLERPPIVLEVAVENSAALSLYHSCGFKETSIYDYYVLNT